MPVFLLTFVEGLLGPKLGKYAKPLIYVVAIALLLTVLGVAKCSYDKSVITKYEQQVQQHAAPATKQADTERAADAQANQNEVQEMHNVVHSVPDAAPAGPSHALACARLRHAGRHPASCS